MKTLLLAAVLFAPAMAQLSESASGMVSTAHPLATEAAAAMLRAGGNAFDAAVAAAATLNVVEPQNSGLGGYGLLLIYDAARKQVRVLNASGRIPAGADRNAFDAKANRRGAKTIAPPVNARAWEELSRRYGRKPWKSLFAFAIEKAERGHVLLEPVNESAFAEFPEHAKTIYGRGGKPLKSGDTLVQRDLGRSLRIVAEQGPGVLHGGELGKRIAAELARTGSFVTLQDIAASRPEWSEPISIDYRGYTVFTAAPPANSFAALIRLGLVSQWNMASLGEDSLEFWHRWAEALKHGEYCRLRYAADPGVASVPLTRLLSTEYWREQAARIDPSKASDFAPPGLSANESANTTHFVVADPQGNIVTMTQTIGNAFGSRVMAPGTGIWLNDSLYYSTFEPRGNPMDVHPGRRKLNSNTPAIVMKHGLPWIAIGAAGGHTIPQTVPFTVARMIDHGKDMAQALASPRIAFVAETKTLHVEPRLAEPVRRSLEAMGHRINVTPIGRLHGLTVEWGPDGKPRKFTGAPDPRGVGAAKGAR
jgi:gamma-glutamyltranspeptidase/glutathione hydrolase